MSLLYFDNFIQCSNQLIIDFAILRKIKSKMTSIMLYYTANLYVFYYIFHSYITNNQLKALIRFKSHPLIKFYIPIPRYRFSRFAPTTLRLIDYYSSVKSVEEFVKF